MSPHRPCRCRGGCHDAQLHPSFILTIHIAIYTETICASLESGDGGTSVGWLDGGEGGTVIGEGFVGPSLSSVVGDWLDGSTGVVGPLSLVAGVVGGLASVGGGLDGGEGTIGSFCSVGSGLDAGGGIL